MAREECEQGDNGATVHREAFEHLRYKWQACGSQPAMLPADEVVLWTQETAYKVEASTTINITREAASSTLREEVEE